ncbi:NAD(P)-binding protein [bacterium]|nr:NAD(P)-binding protein [bacterium]MCP5462654.1 NAD(P)-binding protein [bacterium]
MSLKNPRILILGAGPTGCGAAFYLSTLGYNNWAVYEKNSYVGGLSASYVDRNGFTWDNGGHVVFSHFDYFDSLFDFSCADNHFSHMRNAYAYMMDTLVPYPVQNNIRYLKPEIIWEIIQGLIDRPDKSSPKNFKEWIESQFGKGLANHFMYPYNQKVWSVDLKHMDYNWIAERVSVIELKKVLSAVILQRDDSSWGPNHSFKFPQHGGTQAIYLPVQKLIADKLVLNSEVSKIDIKEKTVYFTNGNIDTYDYLINSIPLDEFAGVLLNGVANESIREKAKKLVSNTVLIIGVGVARKDARKLNWIYFPEPEYPWYRVTFFSNYSPFNVPDENHFSLMGEISYPYGTQPDADEEIQRSLSAFVKCGFLNQDDIETKIASLYHRTIPKAYPVPSCDRDEILHAVQPFLMKNNIYSRGRFGGWKYEVANMDHSVMQGKEAVDAILFNKPETVYTIP